MTETDDLLRPGQLENLWGLSARRVRDLLTQLEQVGFTLSTDYYGARQLPAPVAEAVKSCRQAGLELSTLRERDDMAAFLSTDVSPTADELVDLLQLRAEVAVLREVVGALHSALSSGSQRLGFQPPTDWGNLGLPDPRLGL